MSSSIGKFPKDVAAGFLILILGGRRSAARRGEGGRRPRGGVGALAWRRKARYYRRRNITQKIAGVTPSSLVNYRELPIIIRTVKVFTIVVGQAARGAVMQSLSGPTLSANSPRCILRRPTPPPLLLKARTSTFPPNAGMKPT